MGDEREKRGRRQHNFSHEETLILLDLVEKWKHIVENKKTDAFTSRDKNKAWDNITGEFNAITPSMSRTPASLRQKYDSVKKQTRKYCADRKQTGGGPSEDPQDLKANPIFDRVYALIRGSCDGRVSNFDGDSRTYRETAQPSPSFHSNSAGQEFAEECDVLNEEEAGTLEDIPIEADEEVEPHSLVNVAQNDWGPYCPNMLRMPKHPALETTIATIDANNTVQSNEECKPTTPSQNTISGNVSHPRKRKKTPMSKNKGLSASGKALLPWTIHKTDLLKEQLILLRKKAEADEKREAELHELKIKRFTSIHRIKGAAVVAVPKRLLIILLYFVCLYFTNVFLFFTFY